MEGFFLEDAAELLRSPLALPELSEGQAMRVVEQMKLTFAHNESVLFRAGNPGSPFMVLVLEGDAVVEGRLSAASEPIILRSLTGGSLYGEMGAPDTAARFIEIRAMSDIYLATLDYESLRRITAADPALGCDLLRASLAHVVRRLRTADTWIETLNQINRSLQEEWNSQLKSDRTLMARLNILMNIERKTGLRTFLVGDRIEVRPAAN